MSLFTADAKSLTFLKEEGFLKIPFFQRRYVWDEDNWEELYDNFFGSDIPGFLGSIILKNKEDRKPGDPSECSVIDGQQRLTTLSIFISSLYDSLNDSDKKLYFSDLTNVLYNSTEEFDEDGNVIYIPKVVHSHLDKEEFDYVMDLKNNNKVKENNDGNLINQCYQYFHGRFENEDYEKRKTLLRNLISRTNEILVVIGIKNDADEQKVFDTLNSAGVRLTMADTIKNYLFDKASKIIANSDDFSKEKVVSLYDSTWKKTFCLTDELDKEWSSENVTGRIKRTNVDLFLHCFATIKGIYNPDVDNLEDLPKVYKKYIDSINTIEDMKEFLNELCKFGVLYYSNFMSIESDYKYKWTEGNVLPRLLLFEDTIGTKTFNPYILHIIDKYSSDQNVLNSYLHKIEKILVLTYLNRNTSRSKNYNKLCVDFIEKDTRIDEEIGKLEDLDSGLYGLQKINNNEAKVLLFFVELYRRRDERNDVSELVFSDSYQLEHIMPIKWEKYWTNLPEKDDTGEELNTIEEKINYRNSKIKMLGNMTILKDKLNNKISNANFKTKIDGDGENEGIREYASFKITSEDVVQFYDSGKDWDEIRINERTKNLYEEIKKALLY